MENFGMTINFDRLKDNRTINGYRKSWLCKSRGNSENKDGLIINPCFKESLETYIDKTLKKERICIDPSALFQITMYLRNKYYNMHDEYYTVNIMEYTKMTLEAGVLIEARKN